MTATVQPESKAPSRRAVLAGALGGLGAWAASTIARRSSVRAADGDPVVLGQNNTATLVTSIERTNVGQGFQATANSGIALMGQSQSSVGVYGVSTSLTGAYGTSDSGYGVNGSSNSGIGVAGTSDTNFGVYGESSSHMGVYGWSGATNLPASLGWSAANSTGVYGWSTPDGSGTEPAGKPKTGVYGQATQDSSSRGVWGRANAGRGVFGQATAGVGLYGEATSGVALQATGRTKLSTSGVATIVAGSTSKTITPGVNVTSGSFVLLTPKVKLSGRDLWFTTDASGDKFTIHMSQSRSSGTEVAWLLLG
jgi:hypothetical protein